MSSALAANKGRISLIVVLLLAAAFLVYREFARPGVIPDEINFVCVVTGTTFSLDRDDVYSYPAKNPDTGEMTLLPVYEEDGVWYVSSHYRATVLGFGERNRYVDTNTLAVRKAP